MTHVVLEWAAVNPAGRLHDLPAAGEPADVGGFDGIKVAVGVA